MPRNTWYIRTQSIVTHTRSHAYSAGTDYQLPPPADSEGKVSATTAQPRFALRFFFLFTRSLNLFRQLTRSFSLFSVSMLSPCPATLFSSSDLSGTRTATGTADDHQPQERPNASERERTRVDLPSALPLSVAGTIFGRGLLGNA